MTTKRELILHIKSSSSLAKGLLARARELEGRAANLALPVEAMPPPSEIQVNLTSILEKLPEIHITELGQAMSSQSLTLTGVAEAVQELAQSIEGLPEALSQASIEQLEQLGDRLETQIGEISESVETMISE